MYGILAVSLLFFTSSVSSAQISSSAPLESAQAALQRFCDMEVAGKGLSPEGWNEMAGVLLHSGPPNRRKLIVVKDFVVSKPIVKNDRAELYVEYIYLGQLNSSFARYLQVIPGLPRGPIKVRVEYSLVRTSRGDGRSFSPTWKIERSSEGPPERLHISVAAAISYLNQLRDQERNPVIKRNAKQSIATLNGLQRK